MIEFIPLYLAGLAVGCYLLEFYRIGIVFALVACFLAVHWYGADEE